MKIVACIALFAALLVSGHAATSENKLQDVGKIADVRAPEAPAIVENADGRGLRGVTEDADSATTSTSDKANKTRKTAEISGQSCNFCCNDDDKCGND